MQSRIRIHRGRPLAIDALAGLDRRTNASSRAYGLFARTSMFDLSIVQTEVRNYPYNGPLLRIAATSRDQLEFTSEDTGGLPVEDWLQLVAKCSYHAFRNQAAHRIRNRQFSFGLARQWRARTLKQFRDRALAWKAKYLVIACSRYV